MERQQKIAMVRELYVGLGSKIEEVTSILNLLERGNGAREVALVKTKLQEANHWAYEALSELVGEVKSSQHPHADPNPT